MNKLYGRSLLMLVLTAIFSCKISSEVRREVDIYRRPDKVIELTKENNLNYNTISLKADISVSDGKKKSSFKATIRIKRDSVIWSSMSLLGIAGAKSLLTSDSIMLVNYRDKNFVAEDYDRIHQVLKTDILTLHNLQNLFLGDWLDIAEIDKYKLKIDSSGYALSTLSERRIDKEWLEKKMARYEKRFEKQEQRDSARAFEKAEKRLEKKPEKHEGIAMEVNVDFADLKVTKFRLIDYYFEGELIAEYSDFKDVDNNKLPHKVSMSIITDKPLIVEMKYFKITLNEDITTPYSVPEKYERVRL